MDDSGDDEISLDEELETDEIPIKKDEISKSFYFFLAPQISLCIDVECTEGILFMSVTFFLFVSKLNLQQMFL